MYRSRTLTLSLALAGLAAAWAGFTYSTSAGAPPAGAAPESRPPLSGTADPKTVDLTPLREAVETASKRGENVDEVRKALAAFEKVLPTIKPGTVPPELQALRDAVDDAARKGENVDEIVKQLVAVEMAIAGKSLAKPRPQPKAEPQPQPNPPRPNPGIVPFPELPFPDFQPAAVDPELIRKYLELTKKAQALLLKNPRDPAAVKEAQQLMAEAREILFKAAGGAGIAVPPLMPDLGGRVPERPRLGIRMEKVTPVLAEQLGLEKNRGIVVTAVTEGSAAEKAGLKAHDIILEFAGKAVSDNTDEFALLVNEVKTGEKVNAVVLRKGKKVDVKGIELPDLPNDLPLKPLPAPPVPAVPGKPAIPDLPLKPAPPLAELPLKPARPVPAKPSKPVTIELTPQPPRPVPIKPVEID
jgi:membrane-associated protease RseP (regulator of RpoE activity)